jgi:hypothetical protein
MPGDNDSKMTVNLLYPVAMEEGFDLLFEKVEKQSELELLL